MVQVRGDSEVLIRRPLIIKVSDESSHLDVCEPPEKAITYSQLKVPQIYVYYQYYCYVSPSVALQQLKRTSAGLACIMH